jgi:hypothetical protein
MKLENPIKNEILEYLDLFPNGVVYQIDTVGIFDPTRKVFRKNKSKFKSRSMPDIMFLYRSKCFLIEVKKVDVHQRIIRKLSDYLTKYYKSKTMKHLQNQLLTHIKINKTNDENFNGNIAFIASSIDDVKKVLKENGTRTI